ncbi:MAG: type II toxin-antitoxin system antitoxin SocA domain-containing protein [Bacteroidia bacterium]
MKSPFTNGNAQLARKWESSTFRKEAFLACAWHYVCEDTGETFSTTEQDELILTQVHNLYRAKHHIPFPNEIREIREQYGVSAAKMSEILDLGANSYHNYENGKIPSLANAKLIRTAKSPEQFRQFVEEKKEIFSEKAYAKIMTRVDALLKPDVLEPIVDYIWNHDTEANAFTGFVKPHLEKVAHFVLYFAKHVQPLKTKLNKLLFYADFLHFRETGFAISGCNYRAITLGPVPSHFSELFGLLEDQNYLNIEHKVSDKGVGERFIPAKEFNEALFTEKELGAMATIAKRFKETRTTEIVNLSHEEPAWLDNHKNKKLIDYTKYGFMLEGV